MRQLNAAVAAIVMLTATGCALSASPADGLRFKPPAGWQSSPGILGFMQFWHPPNDDREVLMLFKSPRALRPNEIFSDTHVNDTLKGATIERRSAVVICGRQAATYIEARGTSSKGEDQYIDMMLANIAGTTYFAMYVRPRVLPSNPLAEGALRALCAKS